MGDRGPIPKPARLLELYGSRHAADARSTEAVSPPGAPAPPAHLAGPALEEWDRVVPLLDRAGLIGQLDLAVLVVYCEAWERYLAAGAGLRAGGYLWISKGRAKLSPYHDILERERKALLAAGKRLGLSPAARRGLRPPGAIDDEEDLEAWKASHRRA